MSEQLKPHQIAQLVNKLRDIAREFHAHDCLRELISQEVNRALTTSQQAQAEREAFERWATNDGAWPDNIARSVESPDEYAINEIQQAWLAVQATTSRASQPTQPAAQAGEVDERVAFEAWARPHGYDLRRNDVLGHYSSIDTSRAWSGFRAARASLPTQPAAQPVEVTDCMVNAALSAAGFFSTAESRKDMRNALMAALNSQPAAQATPETVTRSRQCTDAMCACMGGPCAECPEGEREKDIADLRTSLEFYKRRADALQQAQSRMRDPERTMVCDILANGALLVPAGDRYAATPPQQAAGEPVAWWIPKAEQFCMASKDGSRPFAKAWEPLYTHPAPGVPDGFVLVPVEPTPQMTTLVEHDMWDKPFVNGADVWSAVLAAAQAKGGE